MAPSLSSDAHKKEKEHSLLLDRHYSTIGIGECFLSPPPAAANCRFPREYLAVAHHGDDHAQEATRTASIAASHSISSTAIQSWEIVGDIKTTPEDFVVREICRASRPPIPGLTDEEQQALRVATVVPLDEAELKRQQALHSRAHCNDRQQRGHEQQKPKQNDDAAETTKATNDGDKAFLDQNKVEEATNETVETSSSLSSEALLRRELEKSCEGVAVTIRALDDLNQVAKDRIHKIVAHQQLHQSPPSIGIQEIKLDPNPVTITCQASSDTDFDRGALHQSLRALYPLLKAHGEQDRTFTTSDADKDDTNLTQKQQHRLVVTVDTALDDLIPVLYDAPTDLSGLYNFYKRGFYQKCPDAQATLRLRPDLPRSERKAIHVLTAKVMKDSFTRTIPDFDLDNNNSNETSTTSTTTSAIVVQWSKNGQRRAEINRKRKRKDHDDNGASDVHGQQERAMHPAHTLFVLKKRQVEHLTAIEALSKALHCRSSDIGLAGIKDMQAVTYQFGTLRNFAPWQLLRVGRRQLEALENRGIEIGSAHAVNWFLSKADLDGNRFEVTLRNVRRIVVAPNPVSGHFEESFIPCDDNHWNAMIKRVEERGFINYYGEQRLGAPGVSTIVGVRASDIGLAIMQRDFGKAVNLLMTGRLLCRGTRKESDDARAARQTWKNTKGDAKATWKKLPKRGMERERAVLKGLKRYGDPLQALQCLPYNERTYYVSAYQSLVWNFAATARIQEYGVKAVAGDLVFGADGISIEVLSKEQATATALKEVVLPMPGYDVVYPENRVRKVYVDFLSKDEVSFDKAKNVTATTTTSLVPPEATAKGSYRHLIVHAANMNSDRLSSEGDGESCFRLCFDLPSGSFATMLLREVMLATVSREE